MTTNPDIDTYSIEVPSPARNSDLSVEDIAPETPARVVVPEPGTSGKAPGTAPQTTACKKKKRSVELHSKERVQTSPHIKHRGYTFVATGSDGDDQQTDINQFVREILPE